MARRRLIGARRDRGAHYLLITIASFAVTVGATRWYLDLSGYPTVGGGELHVAHALWGGLALVVAAVLALLWVGHRSLVLSALLAGLGVGLFIDEVGKFLTTSTDYFFAPAAPIIYGSILLLVMLWLLVRQSSRDAFDATNAVIDALRDAVSGRLTASERQRVIRLRHETGEPLEGGIDAQLLAVLESAAIDGRLATAGPVASGKARRWLERMLPTRLQRWLIYAGLVLGALTAIVACLPPCWDWRSHLTSTSCRTSTPAASSSPTTTLDDPAAGGLPGDRRHSHRRPGVARRGVRAVA